MTGCGHSYCVPCSEQLKKAYNPRCAVCRVPFDHFTRMRLAANESAGAVASGSDAMDTDGLGEEKEEAVVPADPVEAQLAGIDFSRYGTKVRALVEYTLRAVRTDPTAKLLFFVQFRRLVSVLSRALRELNVTAVSMSGGSVHAKRGALRAFKADPNVKVLLLSYEDSVSGLNLTEANHVVIVHPFVDASEANARAYERQGIARAVRAGQMREVHVVRFASRGTIEEELTNQRAAAAGARIEPVET